MRKCFLLFLLLISCFLTISLNSNGLEPEKDTIRKIFSDWQVKEIKAHHFWAKDSCNWAYIDKYLSNGAVYNDRWKGDDGLGFPDSSEIKFSFADINQDGHLDGLVTFTPEQCDGGNGAMWVQFKILIVSNKEKYDTLDIDNIFKTYGKFRRGFYWLDTIAINKLFGTYYQHKKDDGRYPGIEKRIVIFYDSKKMKFVKERK